MSGLVVQKFGGTSVGNLERVAVVAERIITRKKEGKDVVAVVSAMAGETDRLLTLARQFQSAGSSREVDALIATGEQVSASLLSLALSAKGVTAVSLQGHQVPIFTDQAFGGAQILSVAPQKIRQLLSEGKVVVVTGFQGVTEEGEITTLGRGGSDLTAVALAAALDADQCEIYTDVPGVFTADPQICGDARLIPRISHDEMMELASLGTKVLQARSVQMAKRYEIPVWIGSSFTDDGGTWVTKEEKKMEGTIVAGITCDRTDAQISVRHLPDSLGGMSGLLTALADAKIVVDVIVADRSVDGKTNLTFTVPRPSFAIASAVVKKATEKVPDIQIICREKVAKVSAVGLGMRTHSGVAAKIFQCLAEEKIEVMAVSTSDIKISCVIDEKYGELAVRALHDRFGLGNEPH
ncbi:MAG: aspartate kinase [Pseudomonadota bacterium]